MPRPGICASEITFRRTTKRRWPVCVRVEVQVGMGKVRYTVQQYGDRRPKGSRKTIVNTMERARVCSDPYEASLYVAQFLGIRDELGDVAETLEAMAHV